MQKDRMVHGALLLAALLGGMATVPGLRAQPVARKVDNRFLFVFDTSADMKRRVPAVQNTISNILAARAGGQLNLNDTLGVWTFGPELQTGQFPLQRWKPDEAVKITQTITAFVGSQRYAKKTSFEVLLPTLNQLVKNSERLTMVIFCDGYGGIHGTPYDDGINQVFQHRQGERQKARLPIIIVLHSQLGQYVDCMVSFPPQLVNFPDFPPLPEPVPPVPKEVAAPAPPRPSVPSLIIIGTPATNRPPPLAPITVPANPPVLIATSTPVSVVSAETMPPAVAPLMPTNAVSARLTIAPALLSQTNAVAPPSARPGISRTGAFFMGVAFLAVAGGLAVFLFRRTHKPGGGSSSFLG
ncbi:MAG: hypothetical protein WAO02_06140 [Verrucomicrobiia bacterium]